MQVRKRGGAAGIFELGDPAVQLVEPLADRFQGGAADGDDGLDDLVEQGLGVGTCRSKGPLGLLRERPRDRLLAAAGFARACRRLRGAGFDRDRVVLREADMRVAEVPKTGSYWPFWRAIIRRIKEIS